MTYLKGQDACSFLDGSVLPPPQVITNPSTAPDAPSTIMNLEFLLWTQRDQMILSVLISTLTEPFVILSVGCPITFAL